MQTSLVPYPQNLPLTHWGPKHSRAYQRLLSGLRHHLSQRVPLRIMTLTSVPHTNWASLNGWFQVLRKRVTRQFGPMEYWKIRTFEGRGAGVLHIIYAGPWIPQKWLSNAWKDITGAPIVYIQALKRRAGSRRLARYMVSNYMMRHDIFRQSWSWGWLFRGFVQQWYRVKKLTPNLKTAISVWSRCIMNSDPQRMLKIYFREYFKQTRLKKREFAYNDLVTF